ncbi:MAG: hypothetical protein ACLQBK_04980 [Candidatus Sulfotelmatobacter sp.]
MEPSRVLIGLVILCSVTGAASHQAIYRNQDYGIVLPVPSGALLCAVPADAHGIDHGPQLLLGTKDATLCREWSGKRYMDVFASYNVADDTKLLHDLLEYSCHSEVKKACSPAPTGLHIPGMKTEAGRLDRPDGSLEIIVVTQAGKADPGGDSSVPSINYAFNLNTDPQHLDTDLTIFRAMLNTVRIAPGGH